MVCRCSIVSASMQALMRMRWCTSTDLESLAPIWSPLRPCSHRITARSYRSTRHGTQHQARGGLDLPGLAKALMSYCDAVGVERPILIGNSLGCPIILEVATAFPDRIKRAVMVSPAGGPNNQPLGRAIAQMAMDGLREPPSMVPIASRDYLRFGVIRSLSLFRAMTRYPTLERLPHLAVSTLVIAGLRDPLVKIANAPRLGVVPHIDAVTSRARTRSTSAIRS